MAEMDISLFMPVLTSDLSLLPLFIIGGALYIVFGTTKEPE
jgi:hypothetical protein